MKRASSVSSSRRALLALCASCALCAAPTPGDIGGCGRVVEDLDAAAYFAAKRDVDCDACRQCGFTTRRCSLACEREAGQPDVFPEGCHPLVFDGEVCLRALRHSSCDDYRAYVSDAAAAVPTECDFCPIEERPGVEEQP